MQALYGEDLVNELRRISDTVRNRLWIVVPYIGGKSAVEKILGENYMLNRSIDFRLLTDIAEYNNFNAETIKSFLSRGEIKSLPGLHAKIYIIDDYCLITSANLTNTAFSKRHEIGIFLNAEDSKQSIAIFEDWWQKSATVLLENLKPILKKKATSTEEQSGSKLPNLWKLPKKALWKLPQGPVKINYWLKPIGTTEDPITENRDFGREIEKLHFSVTPISVNVDDYLIAYGIGAKRILSVYKVLEKPKELNPDNASWRKRFPWETQGENLTREFGANWTIHNLYASNLVREYLKLNPDGSITAVGGKTLGGLNFKRDKINLDPNFANFIIQKINEVS